MIKKEQFIEELKQGDVINDFFLVTNVINKNDESAEIIVRDKTGSIKIDLKHRDIINHIKPGDILIIKDGRIVERADELVIELGREGRIEKIEKRSINIKDLIPSIEEKKIKNLIEELRNYINKIEDKNIRILLEKIFSDRDFMERFSKIPSSLNHHHNYLGGNLEHTVNVTKICDFISKMNEDLDRDILLAGAILHDIGKTFEYDPLMIDGKTDNGIFFGHILLGDRFTRKKIEEIRSEGVNFPYEIENFLSHIIVSHHGKKEWGSPVVPKFLEAMVVHYADLLDSHIKYFAQKREEERKNKKNDKWGWIWDNDVKGKRRFYIGDIR